MPRKIKPRTEPPLPGHFTSKADKATDIETRLQGCIGAAIQAGEYDLAQHLCGTAERCKRLVDGYIQNAYNESDMVERNVGSFI